MSRFSVEMRHPEPGETVIQIRGELDLSVAEDLRAAISRTSTDRVVVDLGGCEFIDSTGIAVLLLAAREFTAEGRTLEILHPRDQVLRILEVSGLAGEEGPLIRSREDSPAEAS